MKRFKFYLYLLLFLGVSTLLWWLFKDDAGYVLISANSFRYESTLLLVVLVVVGLWLLWWLLKIVWRLFSKSLNWFNPWSSNKKSFKNNLSLEQGVIAFCSDNSEKAINYLSKGNTLVHQLLLVKSLIQTNKYKDAFNVIQQLNKNTNTKLISEILNYQVLLLTGNYDSALNGIKPLFKEYKREPLIIEVLIKALIKTNNYDEAFNLIVKNKLNITTEDFNLIWRNYIASLNTSNLLISNWHKLASIYSNNIDVIASYAVRLQQLGDASSAEQIVRKSLKQQFQSHLIYVYGDLNSNLDAQLKFALSLLNNNKSDHNLYLTLAKLNMRQNFYVKAHEYLIRSIKLKNCDETQRLLALTLLKMTDVDQAVNVLTKAMQA